MLSARAFIACVCLTIFAGAIALRIEYLNAGLGGYLPHYEGKWRFAARAAERLSQERRIRDARFQQFLETQERAPTDQELKDLLASPLIPQEITSIETRVEEQFRKDQRRASLHVWLSTAGLLQYPLSLACTVWGLCLLMSKSPRGLTLRIGAATIVVIAGTCLALAFTRDYYGSLGW